MGYLLRHLGIMPFAGHDYLSMYHQNWARKEHEVPEWMTWVPGIIPHCVTAALPPEDQGQRLLPGQRLLSLPPHLLVVFLSNLVATIA